MGEGISGGHSSEKGRDKPGGRAAPYQNPHYRPSEPPTPPSDEDTNNAFIKAFSPYPEIPAPTPDVQTLPEPEVHVGKREPDRSPSSINLPKGTVVYDEDGEAYIIEELTEVDGTWLRPPKSKGGPARFNFSTIYPNGREDGGKKVRGQYALRRGKLWYGQTAPDIKSPNR